MLCAVPRVKIVFVKRKSFVKCCAPNKSKHTIRDVLDGKNNGANSGFTSHIATAYVSKYLYRP